MTPDQRLCRKKKSGEERGGLRDIMVRSRLFLKKGSEQWGRLDGELRGRGLD